MLRYTIIQYTCLSAVLDPDQYCLYDWNMIYPFFKFISKTVNLFLPRLIGEESFW